MRFVQPVAQRLIRISPQHVRRGGFGVVVAGVAIFTTAAVSASSASANVGKAAHRAAHHVAAPTPTAATIQPLPRHPALVMNAHKTQRRKPNKADVAAPADHGVISALASNGIPEVALNAYRVAAARTAHADPGCGIPWYLLAGIGREESDHGRFAGAVLHADGVSTPKIIGPALDGKHWDYIPAPKNGLALDGDAKYAHALGPMQFIPSTWAQWGADANGDGEADIFNINDAALGAARYLCAAGGDLTTHKGDVAAVLAYNHNSQYLAQVLALADAYHHSIKVKGKPKGNTTGKLPKGHHGGYLPPVNPGAPTAVDPPAKQPKPKHGPETPTQPVSSSPVASTTSASASGSTSASSSSSSSSASSSSSSGASGSASTTSAPSSASASSSGG